MEPVSVIAFPPFSGIRCLMMPYIQGDAESVPDVYAPYKDIIESVFLRKGDVGFLTIDESPVAVGAPHRGQRAKHGRALHTEVGRVPAVWDAEHEDMSLDGDIGHAAVSYPYGCAHFLKAGEVYKIGILTPHESLPVQQNFNRQFLRIVSSGVHGREDYFTRNPLVAFDV